MLVHITVRVNAYGIQTMTEDCVEQMETHSPSYTLVRYDLISKIAASCQC